MPNTTTPPLVISYLRFSTADQLKGNSTRRQLDLSERYAQQRGWTIARALQDKGVSAFRGKNTTAGSLKKLLDLIESGSIPRGSVLLVESLDRLTRQEILQAVELFIGLLRSGLKIVTLGGSQPVEFASETADVTSLMLAVMELGRANSESAWKSSRLLAAWAAKRANIATKPLTAMVPAWLKVQAGKITVDAAKVAIVQRIFQMAIKGHGLRDITSALNSEGSVNISGRAAHYDISYIHKIIRNRAVIGEYQPCKTVYKGVQQRLPIGEPIKAYYPPILSEDTFFAAQHAIASRKRMTGPATKFTNVFKGILFCSDGSAMHMQGSGAWRFYTSANAIARLPDHTKGRFPVIAFETAFMYGGAGMWHVAEVDQRANDYAQQLAAVEGKLEATTKRLAEINAALTDAASAASATALVPVLTALAADKDTLEAKRGELKARIANTKAGSISEVAEDLWKLYDQDTALTEEQRQRLQPLIYRLVERIDVEFSAKSTATAIRCNVTFKDGQKEQYIAEYTPRKAEVWVDGERLSIHKAAAVKPSRKQRQAANAQRPHGQARQ